MCINVKKVLVTTILTCIEDGIEHFQELRFLVNFIRRKSLCICLLQTKEPSSPQSIGGWRVDPRLHSPILKLDSVQTQVEISNGRVTHVVKYLHANQH